MTERDRVMAAHRKAENSLAVLEQAQRDIEATLATGTGILAELEAQRSRIEHAKEGIQKVDESVTASGSILDNMARPWYSIVYWARRAIH